MLPSPAPTERRTERDQPDRSVRDRSDSRCLRGHIALRDVLDWMLSATSEGTFRAMRGTDCSVRMALCVNVLILLPQGVSSGRASGSGKCLTTHDRAASHCTPKKKTVGWGTARGEGKQMPDHLYRADSVVA